MAHLLFSKVLINTTRVPPHFLVMKITGWLSAKCSHQLLQKKGPTRKTLPPKMLRWYVPSELSKLLQSNHVDLKHKALPFTYIFFLVENCKVLTLFLIFDPESFLLGEWAYPIPLFLPGFVPNVAEIY